MRAERLGRKQGACSDKFQAGDVHSSLSFKEGLPTSEAGPGDILHCILGFVSPKVYLAAAAHGEQPQTFCVHTVLSCAVFEMSFSTFFLSLKCLLLHF